MSRLDETIAYIQQLEPAKAASIRRQAERVAPPAQIEKILTLPIGKKEKAKSLLAPVITVINAKDESYRKAGRALLLIDLLYEYHGQGPLDAFLDARRAVILNYNDENVMQVAIQNKLGNIAPIAFTAGGYRTYNDRDSTAAHIAKSFRDVGQRQVGPPAVLTAQGKWMHVYMSNTPYLLHFDEQPGFQGIFTTSASGGCIPVAFLYGGKKGQPLSACSLIHTPGGNPDTGQWDKMLVDGKTPTTIIVFLSTLNIIGSSEKRIFKNHLTGQMHFPESLLLFHYCDKSVNHGVDKWGNFGSAFGPKRQVPDMKGNVNSTGVVMF